MPPPSSSTFVIDGYNLLHAWMLRGRPDRQALTPQELAAFRERLEARLRQFQTARGDPVRIVLVYDGQGGQPRHHGRGSAFEIRFSRAPQTADDVVLRLARELEGGTGVHVVTSDMRDIGKRLRGLRVTHWTSREFAGIVEERLRRRGRTPAPGSEKGEGGKPRVESAAEAEDWVREFGFGEGQGGAPAGKDDDDSKGM